MTGSREGWWTGWGDEHGGVRQTRDASDMPTFPFSRVDARGVGSEEEEGGSTES